MCDMSVSQKHNNDSFTFVNTVKENKKYFSTSEVSRVDKARDSLIMIGQPSERDYKTTVAHQLVKNLDVSTNNLKIAQAIYGKDLGKIQGKTVKIQPDRLPHNYISIPKTILKFFRNIILFGDILHVNTSKICITISTPIRFVSGEELENESASSLLSALLRVGRILQRRGFSITICHLDNQFEAVVPMMQKRFDGFPIELCSAGEHVSEIERCFRTLQERARAIITTLPFSSIPQILLVHAVIFKIWWLNFLPPRNGISNRLSPASIVLGSSPDINKHCIAPFGQYCQVYAVTTNDIVTSRTVGGINMGPTGNSRGTHQFLSTLTGQSIKGH